MGNTYDTFNEILVKLFNDITDIEAQAIITEEFKDISNNDFHIIEAIGCDEPQSMSSVAHKLNITVGTLTIAINNLVKKGYVNRSRSDKDRRVVLISLTDKGITAFIHHKNFHDEMVKATVEGLNDEDRQVLVKALSNLSNFFKNYMNRTS
ncbi:MAG: MarR family transcriptional regulator [Eubacterium sp.]|nr:MarR family transcriptional regulator [Eubacterium sp.]